MKAVAGAIPPSPVRTDWPVEIRLLGQLRLLQNGRLIALDDDDKAAMLLYRLALSPQHRLSRAALLSALWPDRSPELAAPWLDRLVGRLCDLLGERISAPPVLIRDGVYQLNLAAGIGIDVASFDALADAADRLHALGNSALATIYDDHAVRCYRGALCGDDEIATLIERERLHGRYLRLLSRLAAAAFERGDDSASIGYAERIVQEEPCCEEAHRLIIRSRLRLGQPDEALRQYHACRDALSAALGLAPEPATVALLDRIRRDSQAHQA
jgi:DNA-binding SARP family transcriptional activator